MSDDDFLAAIVQLATGKTVIAVFVLCAVGGVIAAAAHDPKPIPVEPITVAMATERARFEERWASSSKGDLVKPVRVVPIIKTVKTVPVVEVAQAQPQPEVQTENAPLPRAKPHTIRRTTVRHADVCTRHHMHKAWTANRKSWRCRK